MAKRFTRRRWRRPQRLTLEGPAPTRRKDIVVSETMTLERDAVVRANRRRVGALFGGFAAAAAVEGVGAGLIASAPVAGGLAGLAVAAAYLAVCWRFGDGWIRRALGVGEPHEPAIELVAAKRLADEAGLPRADVLATPGPSPNAISFGLRLRTLVLTEGVRGLGGLEVEALVARQIAQLGHGDGAVAAAFVLTCGGPQVAVRVQGRPDAVPALLALPLWPASVVVRWLARGLPGRESALRADVQGALLCRYPPGMQRLLESMAVEQADSILTLTDAFWAAPRGPRGTEDVLRRMHLVAEM